MCPASSYSALFTAGHCHGITSATTQLLFATCIKLLKLESACVTEAAALYAHMVSLIKAQLCSGAK